jgi:hypothetical protein
VEHLQAYLIHLSATATCTTQNERSTTRWLTNGGHAGPKWHSSVSPSLVLTGSENLKFKIIFPFILNRPPRGPQAGHRYGICSFLFHIANIEMRTWRDRLIFIKYISFHERIFTIKVIKNL